MCEIQLIKTEHAGHTYVMVFDVRDLRVALRTLTEQAADREHPMPWAVANELQSQILKMRQASRVSLPA